MSDALDQVLRPEERAAYRLQALYRRYGYRAYRINKFEEYDVYARNKSFLVSDQVLTFTDTDGRLMALKPDVTLSIVRHARDGAAGLQKLCYHENVYRPGRGGGFREIPQTGLECLGDLDGYAEGEVVLLAARSLQSISERSVLVLSHLGLLDALLSGLPEAVRDGAARSLGRKSARQLDGLLADAGADGETRRCLAELAALHGPLPEVLPRLEELGGEAAAPFTAELRRLQAMAETAGCAEMLRLDLSAVGDRNYYNGLLLRGYVEGVPEAILSGGRYDNLVRRLGRRMQAIGFAVYLDLLDRMDPLPAYDVDTLLLYGPGETPEQVLRAMGQLDGSVRAEREVPAGITYRRLARLSEGRLEILECDR